MKLLLLTASMALASPFDGTVSSGNIINTDTTPRRNPMMVVDNPACKPSKTLKCGTLSIGWTHEQLMDMARDDGSDKNKILAILILEVERLRSTKSCVPADANGEAK